jgi:Pyruvate/2-oxoacid:ferredoxin oxidoreductase delta subunit
LNDREIYERLRSMLDTYVTGCPAASEIFEILALLFTPGEAELACGLAFAPRPAEEAAKRAGVGVAEAGEMLEAMAGRGVIFSSERDGVRSYALLPVMPGLFEFPLMRGERTELTEKLTPLWRSYMPLLIGDLGSESTAIARVVPVQEEVESSPGVLTYEMIYELIDKARVVGIAHCACRESERRCDAPTEACMVFDGACDFLVERGFARYMTKDAMKDRLRELDGAGLVHQVNNSQEKLTLICNCCPCCCHLLRSITEFDNPRAIASSGFQPEVDVEICVGCATCADERCPVGAIVVDEVASVDESRCIGCGLCVTGCPEKALALVRRDGAGEPAATVREMAMKILADKGRLEDFIELNTG